MQWSLTMNTWEEVKGVCHQEDGEGNKETVDIGKVGGQEGRRVGLVKLSDESNQVLWSLHTSLSSSFSQD